MTAHRVAVGPEPIPGALILNGRRLAAGVSFYRIEDSDTVPGYSLSPSLPNPNDILHAGNPIGSWEYHLPEITDLARRSEKENVAQTLNQTRAAAFQIAIWSLVDNFTISQGTVPSTVIRQKAQRLRADALAECSLTAHNNKVNNRCQPPISEEATKPEMKTIVGDATESSEIIRLDLNSGTPESSFNEEQAIDVRINGVWTVVCTSQETEIDTSRIIPGSLKKNCKAQGEEETQHFGTRVTPLHHASELPVDNDSAIIGLPRLNRNETVEFVWQFGFEAGTIFTPVAGAGSPIITAGSTNLAPNTTTVVTPGNFASLGDLVQRYVVSRVTHWGLLGLLVLALLIAIILRFPDLLLWFLRSLGRLGQWLRGAYNRHQLKGKPVLPPPSKADPT